MNYFPNDGHCKHFKRSCATCQALQDKQYDWGVFLWNPTGHYPRTAAIQVFTSKARADKHVRLPANDEKNWVVRDVRKIEP